MITFLFGSGADTDANNAMPSGADFSQALLLEEYYDIRKTLMGDDITKYKLIYPGSKHVFLQTINSFQEEAKQVLRKCEIDACIEYYENKSKYTKESDLSKNITEWCKNWYTLLKEESSEKEDVKKFFLKYAVFFDSLDEKFNSLRSFLLSGNAKRVINAYLIVFILMIKKAYNPPADFKWTFENVFDLLKGNLFVPDATNSYYRMIQKLDCDVITTNYTDYAAEETGKSVTYLHGKLTWFEDLKRLTILDCSNPHERDMLLSSANKLPFIPFILIPSGVKPIICQKQIEQYSNFIKKLNRNNSLVVAGYRFNSEDNHINSIIGDWLRKKKKRRMYYLNFKNCVCLKSLHWLDDISQREVDCKASDCKESDTFKNDCTNKQVVFFNGIDETNSKDIFANVIDKLGRNC